MRNKLLFALSLCRKARALVTGFDPVKESVMTGKAQIVLCAQDAAERTLRHAQEFCEGLTDFYVMSLTKEELDQITRKPTVVFAVTDCELANLCRKAISEQTAQKEERA